MGRVVIFMLLVVTVVVLWKAFGPGSWNQGQRRLQDNPQPPQIKGPDDDEEFLWTLEKNRFKARRAAEEAARQEEERMRRARERYAQQDDKGTNDAQGTKGTDDGPGGDPGEQHPES